jgi:hypothetical protein
MISSGVQKRWRFIVKVLKMLGFIGCFTVFIWQTFLIGHYSSVRPHTPEPQRGWTVGLSWTHPVSYGTAQEEERIMFLFWVPVPFAALIILGELIKVYVLEDYSGIKGLKGPPHPLKRS